MASWLESRATAGELGAKNRTFWAQVRRDELANLNRSGGLSSALKKIRRNIVRVVFAGVAIGAVMHADEIGEAFSFGESAPQASAPSAPEPNQ